VAQRIGSLFAILAVALLVLLAPYLPASNETFPANTVYYIVLHHAASGAPGFVLPDAPVGAVGVAPARPSSTSPTPNAGRAGATPTIKRTKIVTPRGLSQDITEHEIDVLHRARGFDEIGYNYVIRFDGTIEKGRAEDVRGAHARAWDSRGISYNASSIAICFAGNCDAAPWTKAQEASAYKLILELMRRYHVPPERVIGHRECGMDTDCPGTLIDMDKVRTKVRNLWLLTNGD